MKQLSPADIERYRTEMERDQHTAKRLPLPWESRVLWAFFTIDQLRDTLDNIHRMAAGEESTRDPYGMLQKIQFAADEALR